MLCLCHSMHDMTYSASTSMFTPIYVVLCLLVRFADVMIMISILTEGEWKWKDNNSRDQIRPYAYLPIYQPVYLLTYLPSRIPTYSHNRNPTMLVIVKAAFIPMGQHWKIMTERAATY
jgi:hypothetical protein